jgi:pSer/pThr/pTyr-binding forkhead associated (FHA) protein
MYARLVSLEGCPDIELKDRQVLLGRDARCDVTFDSFLVSRCHCYLAVEAEGVAVLDLGSTNGTRINDLRIARGLLKVGDVLSVAGHQYRVDIYQDL